MWVIFSCVSISLLTVWSVNNIGRRNVVDVLVERTRLSRHIEAALPLVKEESQ